MSNIYELVRDFEDELSHEIETHHLPKVAAEELGLDRRAGYLYVDSDCLVTVGETKMLEYYGGFEYVDAEDRTSVGRFTIWYDTSERVRDCIDYYKDTEENV